MLRLWSFFISTGWTDSFNFCLYSMVNCIYFKVTWSTLCHQQQKKYWRSLTKRSIKWAQGTSLVARANRVHLSCSRLLLRRNRQTKTQIVLFKLGTQCGHPLMSPSLTKELRERKKSIVLIYIMLTFTQTWR